MRNDAVDVNDTSAPVLVERLMLDTFGLVYSEPFGAMRPRNGWAIIGSLIVADAGIEIVPRLGIDPAQRHCLIITAGDIWLRGRGNGAAWKFHPDLGWVAGVSARHPYEDRSFLLASPAMCSSPSGSTHPVLAAL